MKHLKLHPLSFYFRSKLTRKQTKIFGLRDIDNVDIVLPPSFVECRRVIFFDIFSRYCLQYGHFENIVDMLGEIGNWFDPIHLKDKNIYYNLYDSKLVEFDAREPESEEEL